nr:energy-coupling factor transporter transmembrane component T [uncultured Marvinbryantia sp.]
MGAFMLSSRKRKSVLDPRTKLLLILTITSVVIGGGNGGIMNVVKPALTAVPLILFLLERKWKSAFLYTLIYTAAFLGELLLIPNVQGFLNFILVACCGIFARFMPGIAMGIYLVNTTTVSEFMAAMGRMHISQKIAIPLSVMFRFFPTVGEEYSAIGDAMRMRGIRFGGGKPAKMLEYRMVPLLVSCVKIGEELSAAALTRGLGAPVRRTNICRIGFGKFDIAAAVICAVSFFALILSKVCG